MKCPNLFFYLSSLLIVLNNQAADFFHLEHLPQGTKIPVLKLVNLIPMVANTPIRDAQLEDVYVQAVAETPAVNAHIELFGKIKLKSSLPGLQNIGDLDLSVIGKFFSAFGRGAAPVTSPTLLPSAPQSTTVEEAPAGQINPVLSTSVESVLSELPSGFNKQKEYAGYKNVYVEDVPKGVDPRIIIPVANKYVLFDSMMPNYGFNDQKIKQFVKDFSKTPNWQNKQQSTQSTAQLERERDIEKTISKAFVLTSPTQPTTQNYDDYIDIIENILPDQQELLNRLKTERTNVGKPGSSTTAISQAKEYFSRPEVSSLIAQEIATGQKQALELEQISKPIVGAQTIESVAEEESTIEKPIRPLGAGEIEATRSRFESIRKNLEALRETRTEPLQTAQGKPIAISTLLTLLEGARSAFEKNPKPTEFDLVVLENTENILKKIPSQPQAVPAQSAPPSMNREAITAAQSRFIDAIKDLQQRIDATPQGNQKTLLQSRLTILKSNQESFNIFTESALRNADSIPTSSLKIYLTALQNTENFLKEPFVLPPVILPTKEIQLFKEIALKANRVVSSENLPDGLTRYKNSAILTNPKSRETAIPVGDKYLILRNAPQGFLDSIPMNVLENFSKNINRDAQAWKQFTDKLSGKITEDDVTTILPQAKPLTEYEQKRASFIGKIDALNKIISQRTSQITRVGAALFLITLQNPNYRPFQNIQIPDLPPIDIPGIKDIELNNTELGVFLAPPNVFSIWAQGTGRIINIPLLAKVLFSFEKMPVYDPNTGNQAKRDGIPLEASNTGVVLQAGLPEAWKFSDSFSNMKDWDRYQIKRAYVYVSSINYIDYSIPTQLMPSASIAIANVPGRPTVGMLPGIMIRPGLSLYGEINLRKLIPEIFEHLNFAGLETASLYGTISHKPENCQLGIGLPDLVKIENSPFKLGGVWAEIHMKNMATVPGAPALFRPEASVVVALVVQPSPKDETLTFTARVSSDGAGGMVAFSMQGFWNNAFSVEGLSIGDLALQLHIDYKALLAGAPISGAGFTGTFKFGTQVDSTIIKLAALYAMSSTGQEMALQGKIDGSLSIWQVIDGCKALAINRAQQDKKPTKPIEDNYNKILNNAVAKQMGNIAIRNIEIKVAPATVRIGEFFILQGFTAKGELTLLGVTAGMDFNLGQSGLTATGYLSPIKIGDIFSLTGAGMDKQYGTPDDAATMSLALNFLKQHFIITGKVKLLGIEQQTDIFIDTEGLNCTISGKLFNLFDASVVLKSRGDITNPDLYFKASMKQEFTKYIIDETIKALRASTKDSISKINDAQNEVNKLSANVTDLEGQINSRKRRIDELGKNFLEGIKNAPEITKLGIEIAGLETGKAGAIAARETAKGVLESAKGIVGGGSILTEALINISVPLDIRESTIEASVQDIAKGKLPRFTAVASIAGKKLNLDMQLDFSSPEKAQQSANAIAQQILALFK